MTELISRFTEKINFGLFRAFLLLGLLTGIFLGSLSASAQSSPGPSGKQQNYLFALVEDAQDENSPLLSLWLAASYLDSGEISWMPIYPQPLNAGSAPFANAHDPIWVKAQDLDYWQSFSLLREQGMWWDDIIVLDRVSLAKATSLLESEYGNHSVSTWIEPQAALHQEVGLIQQVCERSGDFSNPSTLDSILQLSSEPAHLYTTLSSFEFISLWDQLANRNFEISCNHPWAD